MTIDPKELQADMNAGTPGPWAWEVNRNSKTVNLCGGKWGSDLTVMSFARYGMGGAAPVFWFWEGNVSDEPKRADALAVPAPNRDHHFDWFARIDHPDARRIARLPDLEAAYLAATARAEAAEAELVALRASLPGLLAAERERCAQIVVECASMCLVMGDHCGKNVCLSVVNAIRAMENPT